MDPAASTKSNTYRSSVSCGTWYYIIAFSSVHRYVSTYVHLQTGRQNTSPALRLKGTTRHWKRLHTFHHVLFFAFRLLESKSLGQLNIYTYQFSAIPVSHYTPWGHRYQSANEVTLKYTYHIHTLLCARAHDMNVCVKLQCPRPILNLSNLWNDGFQRIGYTFYIFALCIVALCKCRHQLWISFHPFSCTFQLKSTVFLVPR